MNFIEKHIDDIHLNWENISRKNDITIEFIEKYMGAGIKQVFCTDIGLDGAMMGPSLDLYKNIVSKFPDLHFIASGGIRSIDDILNLETVGCRGAIVGKAIYEGLIKLNDLARC